MRFIISTLLLLATISCKDSTPKMELQSKSKEDVYETPRPNQIESEQNDSITKNINTNQANASDISYRITENEHGFGYQIFNGDKMLINQPHIPAIPGIKGFESKQKAELAAKYIVSEIKNGNFPPTVDENKLREIGALK